MNDTAKLPYRPCVGIALFNDAGRVFVGERVGKTRGQWQMPQGGIDKGEDALDAARRELLEETGVSDAALIGEIEGWLSYDLPSVLVGGVFRGRYRGQKQRWFAFRLDDEAQIDLEYDKRPEFRAYEWVTLEEAVRRIVDFKREVYRGVARGFAHLESISRRV